VLQSILVWCSVLVAVCCSVLQCVAVCCSLPVKCRSRAALRELQCVEVCCSVLGRVAVYLLECVAVHAVWCSVLSQWSAFFGSWGALFGSVLQCGAVSLLECVAVCCSVL